MWTRWCRPGRSPAFPPSSQPEVAGGSDAHEPFTATISPNGRYLFCEEYGHQVNAYIVDLNTNAFALVISGSAANPAEGYVIANDGRSAIFRAGSPKVDP